MAVAHRRFIAWLDAKGIRHEDISAGAEKMTALYRSANLHVGYRLAVKRLWNRDRIRYRSCRIGMSSLSLLYSRDRSSQNVLWLPIAIVFGGDAVTFSNLVTQRQRPQSELTELH